MNGNDSIPPVKPARKNSKPRKKPERRIRILEQPNADTDGWGAVEIAVGKKRDTYLVRFVESDFGFGAIGFEVEKLDTELQTVEAYHVHLSDRPEECSCTCRGCTQHGNCKHKDGLQTLVKLKKWPRLYIPANASEPEGKEPPELDEGAYFDPSDLDDPA